MKIIFAGLYYVFALNTFQASSFKGDYYIALSSEDTVKINLQLSSISSSRSNEMLALSGALLMKKSGFLKSGKDKLALFEKGKIMLETSIKKEYQNAEYRFLRLVIQENCPAILKYHDQVNDDAQQIRNSFQLFAPAVKKAIRDYAKKSKTLKEDEF